MNKSVVMTIKSELVRLRRLIEEKLVVRSKEIFRHVTEFEGQPLSPAQETALAHNRSLKHPAAVGFSCIVISPQPERILKATPIVNEFEN